MPPGWTEFAAVKLDRVVTEKLRVPERVAMKITGHKTRAVFDCNHIVSPGDLQEAARKLSGTISEIAKNPLSKTLDETGRNDHERGIPQQKRGSLSEAPDFVGGADGTRTRDLRRDRPAF